MKEGRIPWTVTVREMMTDEDGNYKIGIPNAGTAPALLKRLGLPLDDLRLQQRAAGTFLEFCNRVNKEERANGHRYYAGGIGHMPRCYIIAKNPKEASLIIFDNLSQPIGHLIRMELRMNGIMDSRQVETARKKLESIKDTLGNENLPVVWENK